MQNSKKPSLLNLEGIREIEEACRRENELMEQGKKMLEMMETKCSGNDLSPEELQVIANAFRNPKLLASSNLLRWWNVVRNNH